MTKEILVKGFQTKESALAEVNRILKVWRKQRRVKSWRWHTPPEALTDGKTWRAYGRIST